jgi:hypothetical protein
MAGGTARGCPPHTAPPPRPSAPGACGWGGEEGGWRGSDFAPLSERHGFARLLSLPIRHTQALCQEVVIWVLRGMGTPVLKQLRMQYLKDSRCPDLSRACSPASAPCTSTSQNRRGTAAPSTAASRSAAFAHRGGGGGRSETRREAGKDPAGSIGLQYCRPTPPCPTTSRTIQSMYRRSAPCPHLGRLVP